jgi:dipeptidyl-peptidase-3
MYSKTPSHLGFPSKDAQSAYYVGNAIVTEDETEELDALVSKHDVRLRNTRLAKNIDLHSREVTYNVLLASAYTNPDGKKLCKTKNGAQVIVTGGDHAEALRNIREDLRRASDTTRVELKKEFIDYYRRFFETGDFQLFDNAQRVWMKDKRPAVEGFMGFNMKYRDPSGSRAEFQTFVGILHLESSRSLHELEKDAQVYIKTLPWVRDAKPGEGGPNGPFEMDVFQPPDFNSIHGRTPSQERKLQ